MKLCSRRLLGKDKVFVSDTLPCIDRRMEPTRAAFSFLLYETLDTFRCVIDSSATARAVFLKQDTR